MLLLKTFIRSCMIIHYIVKENIFDVIVYTLSLHIKDCFKINGKQRIIMPKKGEYVKFRNFKRKKPQQSWVMQILKVL